MPSRKIQDLHPSFAPRVAATQAAWKKAGYDVLVTCTLRSVEEQNALYAQGRTTPGPIVTKAKGGQSWHNFGLAIDVVPLVAGKAMWDESNPIWRALADIAKKQGLSWGGDWTGGFRDIPHFEWHPGLTLKAAKAAWDAGQRPVPIAGA